tara:strand:- start:919 stop:1443 length:525 start_codon:yes stop_codon:yes gene_type:complete
MKTLGIAGWSNSGKTTLISNLVPLLVRQGISVSTIKHAHHHFDIDQPGKDSYEHRRAGAQEVLVSSRNRWALVHENITTKELSLSGLLKKLAPVDLVFIEGFKFGRHSKIEVFREKINKPLLTKDDPMICAVVSDVPLKDILIPVFDINDYKEISSFIINECELLVASRNGSAE